MMRSATRTAAAMLTCACALLAACGGSAPQKVAVATSAKKVVPPPQSSAVTKMVQGTLAAKEPSGRERAIQLFREAIALDPNLWEAHYDLGVVMAGGGDLAGAEDALRRSAKLAPDAIEVVMALAEVERRRGENKEGAEILGDYLRRHPQSPDIQARYVAALRDSGQLDKAMSQARDLLVKRPGDAAALAELALCHLAKGERDMAQLLTQQARTANAKSAVAERATGLVLLAAGDDARAFAAFAKAAQYDPQDTTARLNMGSVLLRAGAYAKAEEQYRAILAVSPEDGDAKIGLAAALRGQGSRERSGKWDEARSVLEGLLAREPHNVAALFNLAVLDIEFLKRPADARPLIVRFLSDAPGDHPARAEAERYLGLLKETAK
ncbi:tetratricopeptide repeat protein [Pendulispora albinea]|uniref:Tetratricopeptide repeat protein n=1 Tax=Pendulispora albinea TaxID=2741071 RepID=A0ABZ2LYZ3_9BACT